jgi:hypothetical protein
LGEVVITGQLPTIQTISHRLSDMIYLLARHRNSNNLFFHRITRFPRLQYHLFEPAYNLFLESATWPLLLPLRQVTMIVLSAEFH